MAPSKSQAHQKRVAEFLTFQSGERKIRVPRPETYQAAVSLVRRNFAQFRDECTSLKLSAKDYDISSQSDISITEDEWSSIIADVDVVHVEAAIPSTALEADEAETAVRFTIQQLTGKRHRVKATSSAIFADVAQAFADYTGVDIDRCRFFYAGKQLNLEDMSTLSSLRIRDGSTVHLQFRLRGGKPIIYLFPPSHASLTARVTLTLVHQWSFSALYPIAAIKRVLMADGRQGDCVQWDFDVKANGELVDLNSNVEVSYAFWEAHTNPTLPPSPVSRPSTPNISNISIASAEGFNPSMPQLDTNNSVLLSISEVPAYLDKALKALDLHVEARTSFITYWLPDLLKHQYIALRFVPQKEYEKAAVLDILPTPNVVERIFMLFQGIESALATNPEWVHAKEKAEADVLFWREVVGLPGEAGELMKDDSLFRVLEWGGMEVL